MSNAIERGLRFGAAIVFSSLAAGPIFWLSLVLIGLPFGREAPDFGSSLFGIMTIPIVVIIAVPPNLIGTATMTALGAWLPWARSPLAWIGAGALGGALFATLSAEGVPRDLHLLAATVLTGMACAAIWRAFTRWPDADAQA